MASPAPSRSSPLHPGDWIQAALSRLRERGIDAVRVELLARDLGVSKGSFYWHFHDRADLLEAMLSLWEAEEVEWLEAAGHGMSPAARWASFLGRTAEPERVRTEGALLAWAQSDAEIASRVAAIQEKRSNLIAEVLHDTGFALPAAKFWSEIASLLCLGWQDRMTRGTKIPLSSRSLGDLLSEVILAATARSST